MTYLQSQSGEDEEGDGQEDEPRDLVRRVPLLLASRLSRDGRSGDVRRGGVGGRSGGVVRSGGGGCSGEKVRGRGGGVSGLEFGDIDVLREENG